MLIEGISEEISERINKILNNQAIPLLNNPVRLNGFLNKLKEYILNNYDVKLSVTTLNKQLIKIYQKNKEEKQIDWEEVLATNKEKCEEIIKQMQESILPIKEVIEQDRLLLCLSENSGIKLTSLRQQLKQLQQIGKLKLKQDLEKEKLKKQASEKFQEIYNKKNQADTFLKEQPFFYDEAGLWWLWDYNNEFYRQVDEVEMLNMIDRTNPRTNIINSTERTEILNSLKQRGRLYLPEKLPLNFIQFKDCIIDLNTGEKLKVSHEWFLLNPLPYKYGDSPDTPVMDKIIADWVGKDYVQTMYDILAFTIYRDYFMKRIFAFVGSGNNGKSCWFNLCGKFLGSKNIVSTEADLLTTNRFEMFKLLYKLVAMMSETEDNDIKQTKILKKLSGNDIIDFEQKYAKKTISERNYAKIWINTNLCPDVSDSSQGWIDRQLIITFPNTYDGKIDILATIPEIEYENLGNKCIKILRNLIKTRTIHNEGTFETRKKNYEAHSNPINLFLKNYTSEDANGFIFKWEFKERLTAWSEKNKSKILTDTTIGTKMKELGYLEAKHISTWFDDKGNKKQYMAWEGIKWKD